MLIAFLTNYPYNKAWKWGAIMRKICFFDIDGTIIGKSRQITQANLEALHTLRSNGHLAFLCTGRAPSSIFSNIIHIGWDGIIASAGSFVFVDRKQIYENAIDPNLLLQIIYLFTKHKIMFTLETKFTLYQSPGIKEFFDAHFKNDKNPNLEAVRAKEDREMNECRKPLAEYDGVVPVAKVCFIAKDKEAFTSLIPYFEEHFNIVYFNHEDEPFMNGELIQKSCTKGDGIKRVVEHLGARMEDTIAFGDSMNDHEMLLEASESYVSELSSDYLKSISDGTFEEPDQDGIAKILKQLQLI